MQNPGLRRVLGAGTEVGWGAVIAWLPGLDCCAGPSLPAAAVFLLQGEVGSPVGGWTHIKEGWGHGGGSQEQ